MELPSIQQHHQLLETDSTHKTSSPKLSALLSEVPLAERKVWFAPYTTFPETGVVESRLRQGVYDTFKTFPDSGISSNYGAFKHSPADSLFTQASSQGLVAEAHLAQRLGYRFFALDLGAVEDPIEALKLCRQITGCQHTSDGYSLYPMNRKAIIWIRSLAAFQRRIPLLPQQSASPRWNGLVFAPNQWWLPKAESLKAATGSMRIRARALWALSLYRYEPSELPASARANLASRELSVKALLGPGLKGADLCIASKVTATSKNRCQIVSLRSGDGPVEITPWLSQGSVTQIQVEAIYDKYGLPTTMERLPSVDNSELQPSPFSLAITPLRLH